MISNEAVTQKLRHAQNKFDACRSWTGQEHSCDLQDALRAAVDGLQGWSGAFTTGSGLTEPAEKALAGVTDLSRSAEEVDKIISVMKSIHRRQDMIIEQILFRLKKALEQIVDPAIKAAANSRNLQAVTQWGQIDMIMNEAIIANVFKLQNAALDYKTNGCEASWNRLQAAQETAADGLAAWGEVIAGTDGLRSIHGFVTDSLKAYAGLSLDFHDALELIQEKKASFRQQVQLVLKDPGLLMAVNIDAEQDVRVEAAGRIHPPGRMMILIGIALSFILWLFFLPSFNLI